MAFAVLWTASAATAHVPTVSNAACTVRGWTHADHAADEIGVTAFLQNQNGIVRGVGHGNVVYKFRAPWPQVPCVPPTPTWNSSGGLRTFAPAGFEWWWSRAGGTPGGGEAIALYDNRPYVPNSGPSNFNNFVVLGPNETTLDGPLDGNVRFPDRLPVETVINTPPADFVRGAIPTVAAAPPDVRNALVAVPGAPVAATCNHAGGTLIRQGRLIFANVGVHCNVVRRHRFLIQYYNDGAWHRAGAVDTARGRNVTLYAQGYGTPTSVPIAWRAVLNGRGIDALATKLLGGRV